MMPNIDDIFFEMTIAWHLAQDQFPEGIQSVEDDKIHNWVKKLLLECNGSDPNLQFALGMAAAHGWNGQLRNLMKACDHFLAAAETRHCEATAALGYFFDKRYLSQAAYDFSHAWSLYDMSNNECIKAAADLGLAAAQYRLGTGSELADESQRFHYLKRAANNGHIRAQADLYEHSLCGHPLSTHEIAQWKHSHEIVSETFYFGTNVRKSNRISISDFIFPMGGDMEGMNLHQLITNLTESSDSALIMQTVVTPAEQGDATAQYALGIAYRDGLNFPVDKQSAILWLQKSANGGHPDAMLALSMAYIHGDGIQADLNLAAHWLAQAEESSTYDDFYCDDSTIQDIAWKVPVSVSGIVTNGWIPFMAERGCPDAMLSLGLSQRNSAPDSAAQWLSKACEAGIGRGCRSLLELYQDDRHFQLFGALDDSKHLDLLNRAAQLGDAESQYKLARHIFTTAACEKATSEGVRWLLKAAEAGDASAQFYLAELYRTGSKGVNNNEAEAFRLYSKAFPRFSEAGVRIGLALIEGCGVEKDVTAGIHTLGRCAFVFHDSYAEYLLGSIYVWGIGVEKDYLYGLMWWQQAASDGNLLARIALASDRTTR